MQASACATRTTSKSISALLSSAAGIASPPQALDEDLSAVSKVSTNPSTTKTADRAPAIAGQAIGKEDWCCECAECLLKALPKEAPSTPLTSVLRAMQPDSAAAKTGAAHELSPAAADFLSFLPTACPYALAHCASEAAASTPHPSMLQLSAAEITAGRPTAPQQLSPDAADSLSSQYVALPEASNSTPQQDVLCPSATETTASTPAATHQLIPAAVDLLASLFPECSAVEIDKRDPSLSQSHH